MASTRNQCSMGADVWSGAPAASTPGSMGLCDSGQPAFCSIQGDTPGPAGTGGDLAAGQTDGWMCRPYAGVPPTKRDALSEAVEVWVVAKEFVLAHPSSVTAHLGEVKDAVGPLRQQIAEFGIHGRYYTKFYKGVEYIIFKGDKTLRDTITGDRYRLDSAKVMDMGIGRAALRAGLAEAAHLGVVVVAVTDIGELVIRDLLGGHEDFSELCGKLMADIPKSIVSTMAGFAVATWVASAVGAAGAVVCLPVAAGILVACAVGAGLDWLDIRFKVTEKLVELAKYEGREMMATLAAAHARLNRAGRDLANSVELLVQTATDVERLGQEYRQLRQLLSLPAIEYGLPWKSR